MKKENTKSWKFYIFLKRCIDILAGIVGMIVLIPLTACVCVLRIIHNEYTGSIFYTQDRIGKNGKIFKMYKYRTMDENADEKLKEYLNTNKEANMEYKQYKKLKHDPRVTKLGEFLRNTSIDEFPQFLNVLKGEMSLIGPRPYLPKEKEDMRESYFDIINCKPGITGYWQANGRSDVTFECRLKMENYYSKNRSILFDTKIFFYTIFNLISKKGAY